MAYSKTQLKMNGDKKSPFGLFSMGKLSDKSKNS
jgi:hypothetical protein